MGNDLVRTIKGFEREFLDSNLELYKEDRMEFLRKREEYIAKRLVEKKNE
ncbi:hypothetical protein J4442_01200 [Candidatus Woesearchaeota archaeon]|nr:hypothetical protein [Candidatus Woesearchaeota archaeon]